MSEEYHHDRCAERRDAEIALLQAMYPSDLVWHEQRQEITYKPKVGGSLTLRLPHEYPSEVQPIIIQAVDTDKDDIRDAFRQRITAMGMLSGEESLDTLVQLFDETIRERQETIQVTHAAFKDDQEAPRKVSYKTVIVWLHHLLNTNKRKLALNPSDSMGLISGVTKPGYPGVLVYSGATNAVDAHVAQLKIQRWQAFQIRFEEIGDDIWNFSHGPSIEEVESMSEVAQSISADDHRQKFLEAVGIK